MHANNPNNSVLVDAIVDGSPNTGAHPFKLIFPLCFLINDHAWAALFLYTDPSHTAARLFALRCLAIRRNLGDE